MKDHSEGSLGSFQMMPFPLPKSMQSLKTVSKQLFDSMSVTSWRLKYHRLYHVLEDLSRFKGISAIDAFAFERFNHFINKYMQSTSLRKGICLKEAVKLVYEQYSRSDFSGKNPYRALNRN